MAVTLTDINISDRQELMTGPAPDGRSLWLLSGVANIGLMVTSQEPAKKETYKLLLGPVFQGRVRATAIAWASSVATFQQASWAVRSAEADFDDESGRIELMFEVEVGMDRMGASDGVVSVKTVTYQVSIHGNPTG